MTQRIQEIANFRDSITISNSNAIEFITQLSITYEPEELFIYFDPPYYRKGELLYLNHFDHRQHVVLRNHIQDTSFAWILSYDDEAEIREMYDSIPIYKKALQYSIAKPSIGHELIISRLQMPDELQRIMR